VIALRPRGIAGTNDAREHTPSERVGAESPSNIGTVHTVPPLLADDPVSTPPPELLEAALRRKRRPFLSSVVAAGPTFTPSVPPSVAVTPGAGPVSALAKQVVSGMEPAWNEAHRISHEALTVEQQPLTQERASQPTNAAVKNTFNVSVHLEPGGVGSTLDRTTLEDALVDILRDAARRHGLEV
jgi:hypothetical protein